MQRDADTLKGESHIPKTEEETKTFIFCSGYFDYRSLFFQQKNGTCGIKRFSARRGKI